MKILVIANNELRCLFYSPLAWIILAFVQFILAIFFYVYLSQYLEHPGFFSNNGLTEIVIASLLQTAGALILLVTPFLTMRLFSEEMRSGTIKLLLSSPISITELVIGKFTGVVIFMLCMIIMITLMPASLYLGTELDTGQFISGLFGLTLLSSTSVSIGLFISTLTRQPAVAAVSTFAVVIMLWLIHIAANSGNQLTASVFSYLSMLRHYNQLVDGIISSVDVAYYLILIITFTALSIWRIDAMRTYHW